MVENCNVNSIIYIGILHFVKSGGLKSGFTSLKEIRKSLSTFSWLVYFQVAIFLEIKEVYLDGNVKIIYASNFFFLHQSFFRCFD